MVQGIGGARDLGELGGTLGSLWGHFGLTLGSLWVHFELTSGQFLAYEDAFGALSEPFQRRNALDGKCDGYMCRLGGGEKRKC